MAGGTSLRKETVKLKDVIAAKRLLESFQLELLSFARLTYSSQGGKDTRSHLCLCRHTRTGVLTVMVYYVGALQYVTDGRSYAVTPTTRKRLSRHARTIADYYAAKKTMDPEFNGILIGPSYKLKPLKELFDYDTD